MKKFDLQMPLWQYKLREYLLLYDGGTEEDRLLAYRFGWQVFSSHRHHFEDFANFVRRRKWFIYLSLVYPILFTLFSVLLALSLFTVEVLLKVPLALVFSAVTAGIIYNLIGNTFKNIRETGIFLSYIDPTEKLDNYREFESVDIDDREAASIFYENIRAKRDYEPIMNLANNLDKTEKLLAIDFLLGWPGSLHELVNKLCIDPRQGLSKEGIYRVLGEILVASPGNIKKEITKGLGEIRTRECLSPQRIDQLRNVKAVFNRSKLPLKAIEIDRLIDLPERPTVGLNNRVEYHKQE